MALLLWGMLGGSSLLACAAQRSVADHPYIGGDYAAAARAYAELLDGAAVGDREETLFRYAVALALSSPSEAGVTEGAMEAAQTLLEEFPEGRYRAPAALLLAQWRRLAELHVAAAGHDGALEQAEAAVAKRDKDLRELVLKLDAAEQELQRREAEIKELRAELGQLKAIDLDR